jgi:hypothetical protein
LAPGLANFVDNNCWYLFGTRLHSDFVIARPFTDAAKTVKLCIVSSDDERDADKKSGKENKKLRLGRRKRTGDAGGPANSTRCQSYDREQQRKRCKKRFHVRMLIYLMLKKLCSLLSA